MNKKYVVKDFRSGLFWAGNYYGWKEEVFYIKYFDTFESAENFIEGKFGDFQIEAVYKQDI